ncbi:MAG TPA: hypothetical protein VMN39_10400, partial [Longimicrobiaceae bacterium]|nr:hypothetical protein [Longimicrobiaceae bacterium]
AETLHDRYKCLDFLRLQVVEGGFANPGRMACGSTIQRRISDAVSRLPTPSSGLRGLPTPAIE